MVKAALRCTLNTSTGSCGAIHYLIDFLVTRQITRHTWACRYYVSATYHRILPSILYYTVTMIDSGVMSCLSLSPDPFVAVYSLHQTTLPRLPTPPPVSGTPPGVKTRLAPHAKQQPGISMSSAYAPDVVPCLAVSWDCYCLDL
jgi:hypothetical protein